LDEKNGKCKRDVIWKKDDGKWAMSYTSSILPLPSYITL